MKYSVTINSINTVDELEGSWSATDYIELLKRFGFPEADQVKPSELKEFLFMAIADFDAVEAASIVLDYKLSEKLATGQIDNLSHEMLREKIAENYSDIALHKALFEVNQLLYKVYNGKFPLTRATVITFEMDSEQEEETEISKETALLALSSGLSESNLIRRLFEEQLAGKAPFPEAEDIIWCLQSKGNGQYVMTTSEKWILKEDFREAAFEGTVVLFEEPADED